MKTYNIKNLIQAAHDTIAQGYSCKNEQGLCVYNHSNGVDHCIIGHMLKDDAHAQSMLSNVLLRGAPVRVLIQNDVFSMYSKLDEDLLYEMQYTHDSVSAWANGIESAFNTILNKYGYSL